MAPTAAASGSDDGTVCMWDLMTGACIYQLSGHPNGSVLALLYTHTHVISTGTDNRICIWERQQGHLLHALHLVSALFIIVAKHAQYMAVLGSVSPKTPISSDKVKIIIIIINN